MSQVNGYAAHIKCGQSSVWVTATEGGVRSEPLEGFVISVTLRMCVAFRSGDGAGLRELLEFSKTTEVIFGNINPIWSVNGFDGDSITAGPQCATSARQVGYLARMVVDSERSV